MQVGRKSLPLELVPEILRHAPARDILACSATCHRFKSIVESDPHLNLVIELAIEGLRLRSYPPALEAFAFREKTPLERLEAFRWAKYVWKWTLPPPPIYLRRLGRRTWCSSALVCSIHQGEERAEKLVFHSIWQPAESTPWREYMAPSEIVVHVLTWDLSQDLLVIRGGDGSLPKDVDCPARIYIASC